MGDTCDISILDLTRSGRLGFTTHIDLLNVGNSRSRYGVYSIGNGQLMKRSSGLSKVWHWCKSRDAVSTIFEDKIPGACPLCFGSSHGTNKKGIPKPCRAQLTRDSCGNQQGRTSVCSDCTLRVGYGDPALLAETSAPLAARSLRNQFPDDFKPAMILFEETGRHTEPDLLATIALFPSDSAVWHLFSGDHLQIGPHVFSQNMNIFARQLYLSLLKRAVKAGFPVLGLNTNWRSHFGIEGLSPALAYGGRMISAYGNDLEVPRADIVHRFIERMAQTGGKPKGNIILFDVKGNSETPQDTETPQAQDDQPRAAQLRDQLAAEVVASWNDCNVTADEAELSRIIEEGL